MNTQDASIKNNHIQTHLAKERDSKKKDWMLNLIEYLSI